MATAMYLAEAVTSNGIYIADAAVLAASVR